MLTDEIYEHIVYDAEHVPPATVPGLEDRTVTINALSKTYAVTGWRVGWAIAPAEITDSIRKVHREMAAGGVSVLDAPVSGGPQGAVVIPKEPREVFGPYPRMPVVGKWVRGELPEVRRLFVPAELIREIYPEPVVAEGEG